MLKTRHRRILLLVFTFGFWLGFACLIIFWDRDFYKEPQVDVPFAVSFTEPSSELSGIPEKNVRTVRVALSTPLNESIKVYWALDQLTEGDAATNPKDHDLPENGVLIIPAGESHAEITFATPESSLFSKKKKRTLYLLGTNQALGQPGVHWKHHLYFSSAPDKPQASSKYGSNQNSDFTEALNW